MRLSAAYRRGAVITAPRMTLAALVHMLPMGVIVDEVGGPVEGFLKTKVTGLTCRDPSSTRRDAA